MRGVTRALIAVPHAFLKLSCAKLLNFKKTKFGRLPRIDHSTEITLQGETIIGNRFNMRRGSALRCREKGKLKIGNNVSFGMNNIIVCLDQIEIGDDCEFGPNVCVFDHDHDYKNKNGLSSNQYKTAPIIIGKNVWIGANTIILRGTKIGDNSVIAAGSIIKGGYPNNSIIIQKRETSVTGYSFNEDED